MKLTKSQLRQLIKEEFDQAIRNGHAEEPKRHDLRADFGTGSGAEYV